MKHRTAEQHIIYLFQNKIITKAEIDPANYKKEFHRIFNLYLNFGHNQEQISNLFKLSSPSVLWRIKQYLMKEGFEFDENKIQSTKDFIRKSIKKHGPVYCYEKTKYEEAYKKVTITCHIHGDFGVTPNNHLYQGNGCSEGQCLKFTKEEYEVFVNGHIICRTCGAKKSVSGENFPIRKSGNYRRQCRDCMANIEKSRRKELGEEYLISERKRHLENKEKRNIGSKKGYYRRKNDKVFQAKERARNRARAKRDKHKWRAMVAKRRAAKIRATPTWLTKELNNQMELIYKEAFERSDLENVKYHVDHIVPLQGGNVCGLHVPWNLQLLKADENWSKGNKNEEINN